MASQREIDRLKAKKDKLIRISRKTRNPIYQGEITNRYYQLYFEEANLDGVPYSMPFIILPTRPCSWLLKSGGCFECGYSNLSSRDIEDDGILSLLDECVDLLRSMPHEMVAIGTSGSFLDEQELSKDAQNQVLRRIALLPDIRYIGIESRPEYITEERTSEIGAIVFPKRIMLGMGLESSSDLVREFCINKGLTVAHFLRALDSIQQCDNISALAYVLLGKPFLPEEIDVEDAISSTNFAIDAGFDRVVLMATSLRENTLARVLYEIGEYEPPSPRRTIEVLKRLKPRVRDKVIIANPRLPKPIAVSQCPTCSKLLAQLLKIYKYTSNYNYIRLADRVSLSCRCTEKWRGVSTKREVVLEQLILDSYERVLAKVGGSRDE